MDQNNAPNDATGGQPAAGSGSGDTSAWNQAPPQDQAQPPAAGGQEAAAEYAAWSADASYQQAANPADTQAHAAPEPQSAAYGDPQAAQQQYAQQQQYQQQPQAYDQQAYDQQQQQYAQQQQQQYQQQQAYDQQAYQQQQQQQQQQQPQYYDQSAYGQQQPQQPQYYDQSAYGQQQPGYYDQSAYGQQQYPQQPAQPYAYAQPGQDQYYAEGEGGYNRSFLAVLAGWVLLTWGFVWGIAGALVLYAQSVTDWLGGVALSGEATDLIADIEATQERIVGFGGILVIIGIVHLIGAVGIFGHRRWGRAFGLVLGFLGILAALGIFTVSSGFEAMDVGLEAAIEGEESSVAASLFVLGCYLLVFVGMIFGRRQFKKKGVQD